MKYLSSIITAQIISSILIIGCHSKAEEKEVIVLNENGLPLYLESDRDSNKLALVPFESNVTILNSDNEDNGWYHIRWNEKEGWVHSPGLSKQTEDERKQIPVFNTIADNFESVSLPYNTNQFNPGSLTKLKPGQIPASLLPEESSLPGSPEFYFFNRLPDFHDITVVVIGTIQQESGGLLLTLVSYNNQGRPIDELEIKSDVDAGNVFYTRDSLIDRNYLISIKEIEVSGEYVNENFIQDSRNEVTVKHHLDPSGKFIRLESL